MSSSLLRKDLFLFPPLLSSSGHKTSANLLMQNSSRLHTTSASTLKSNSPILILYGFLQFGVRRHRSGRCGDERSTCASEDQLSEEAATAQKEKSTIAHIWLERLLASKFNKPIYEYKYFLFYEPTDRFRCHEITSPMPQ